MRLSVRLFGGLTQAAGASHIDVEVADGATVAELREAIVRTHPGLGSTLHAVNVAVDLEVADASLRLHPDNEVALLPPVAGGSAGYDQPSEEQPHDQALRVRTGLVTPPFAVERVIAEVSGPTVGATATFLGTVRDHAPDLDDVVELEYSVYIPMAEKELADIAVEIGNEYALTGVALLHAVGTLPVGAQTILIVCTSAHRGDAFDACRDALEQAKNRVPVFKREITADGADRWVGMPEAGTPEGT